MIFTDTISTTELVSCRTSTWVIVDGRFDLSNPDWGHDQYLQAHIPGAVYADLNKHLAASPSPISGRHPLPSITSFLEHVAAWDISSNSQVVIYDSVNGAFAARLWWMLNAIGINSVAILEGGFSRWEQEKRPVNSGNESNASVQHLIVPGYNPSMFITTHELEQNLTSKEWLLIDARSPERYRGEVEPIDPIAGHIPGAINRFHGLNLQPNGDFKPATVLSTEFRQIIGEIAPTKVVVYCGSGVTSIHHIIAMKKAGIVGARLYVGSWSEWIREPHRPIVIGK